MFAMLTTACEVLESPKHTPELELTSNDTLRVDRLGGEFEITYNLLHASFGTTVSVQVVNSTMITDVDTTDMGKVVITISENPTDAIREGAVIVSYESMSFTVLVQQDFVEVEKRFKAMGFDRAFGPGTAPETTIAALKEDLGVEA
jgi:hypothetical protein